MTLLKDFKLEKYGIKLRLVDKIDAEFIYDLRTNGSLNQYLSPINKDVANQVQWIKEYKKREAMGQEYYFLVEDNSGNKLGTIRLYNFSNGGVEVGSWVFKQGGFLNGASIKAYILCLQVVFEILKYKNCLLNVHKKNARVKGFHLSFQPNVLSENEENLYLELGEDSFYKRAAELLENLEMSIVPIVMTLK